MKKQFSSAFLASPVILAALLFLGCNKSGQPTGVAAPPAIAPAGSASVQASENDKDAITQAIEDHVRNNKGINMAAMDISVDSVQVNGDQAQANATFRLKQGGTSMVMAYSLSRHAGGWIVMSDQPADGQFVHPPMDKVHSTLGGPHAAAPTGSTMPDFTELLKPQAGNKQK